jgi:PAS domain-containing protein
VCWNHHKIASKQVLDLVPLLRRNTRPDCFTRFNHGSSSSLTAPAALVTVIVDKYVRRTQFLVSKDLQDLVHELQVHQIELEMQNEELRQGQLKLEELNYRYLDLYGFAPVGYVTLNDKGLILEANLTAVRLLGEQRPTWIERTFSSFVCPGGDWKASETSSTLACRLLLVPESWKK